MFKHWAVSHKDLKTPPKFSFKVLSCHKDPLTRMVDEAVKIHHSATMNSKSEYRSFKLNRIKVDKDSWEILKDEAEAERVDKAEEVEMSKLREMLADNVINPPPPH